MADGGALRLFASGTTARLMTRVRSRPYPQVPRGNCGGGGPI